MHLNSAHLTYFQDRVVHTQLDNFLFRNPTFQLLPKICIKYRKHGNSSFSHTFNCVCFSLFLTFIYFFKNFFLNIVASVLKSYIFERKKLAQNRLRHTQLNVREKEELPCFLYLIQIFGMP